MVKIEGKYTGGLQMTLVHQSSQTSLKTSAPLDNGGDGSSFSPTDLLAASMLSCVITTMAIKAKNLAIDFENVQGSVEKHMVADPQRRVGNLVLRILMPRSLSEDQRKSLELAGRACPVAKSISEKLEVDLEFHLQT